LDAVQRAVEGGLVEVGDERRVRAVGFDRKILEDLAGDAAETTRDGDPVAVRAHVAPIASSMAAYWHYP